MTEPRWISAEIARDVHAGVLAMFGGTGGERAPQRLDRVLDAPRGRWADGGADVADVAASLAASILSGRPFVDGNRQTAFACTMLFLRLNGLDFRPTPAEATAALLSLEDGSIDLATFTDWIRTGP